MSADRAYWRTLFICLCILGLIPVASDARDNDSEKREQKSQQQFLPGERPPNGPVKSKPSKKHKKNQPAPHRSEQRHPKKRERTDREKSRKDRDRHQPAPPRTEQRHPKKRERTDREKSRKDRDRHQPAPQRTEQRQPKKHERPDRERSQKDRDRHQPAPPRAEQRQPKKRERTDRDHRTRTKPRQDSHSSHDRHYKRYSTKHRRHHYHRHETYRYHTHYLAPIRYHYHQIGFRLTFLPHSHVRIFIHGLPYFYFGGVFYRYHSSGYIVVRAPIGAIVQVLPVGFIAFNLGGFTYYYVNDVYYTWDDDQEAYVVVEKPDDADAAIVEATEDRLFVYPNQGQNEEQQAKDRYECHRWAVRESHVDPSMDDEDELGHEDKSNYKRAISACLEGRGYTVK